MKNPASMPMIPETLPMDTLVSFDAGRTRIGWEETRWQSDPEPATPVTHASSEIAALMASGSPKVEPGMHLYRIVGRGGFGEVWEALQVSLDRVVAVKRLRDDTARRIESNSDEHAAVSDVFRQEARITARLEHPNIAPMHELSDDSSGRPMLTMKMLRGRPWNEIIRDDFAVLSEEKFLERHLPILLSMAQAVAFAHSRGVVHRDLKPTQVMVGEFGEVLLLDWGLALVHDMDRFGPTSQPVPTSETASSPAGTVAFMAPEQTDPNALRISPQTDVWLLGGTLYFLLTGQLPHCGETSRDAYFRAMEGIVTAPAERSPDREIPQELAEIAMACLRPDPADRIPGADGFLARMRDFLSGASRRREAEGLLFHAQQILARGGIGYQELSTCAAQLTRAQGLAPQLESVRSTSLQLAERFAMEALQRGDLALAQTQVDSLPESTRRTELDAEIRACAARLRATRRQRGIAVAASISLATALAIGGLFYARDQQRSREDLEKVLHAMAEQRDSGELLVQQMLGDLQMRLSLLGRLDLMEEVSRLTLEYYASLPQEDFSTPLAKLQRARAMRIIGDLLLARGHTADAREAFAEAGRVIARADSTDPRTAIEHAQLLISMNEHKRVTGDRTDDSYMHQALALLAPLQDSGLHSAPIADAYGRALFTQAESASNRGELSQALQLYEDAITSYREGKQLAGTTEDSYDLFAARARAARTLQLLGRTEAAITQYEEVGNELSALLQRTPENLLLASLHANNMDTLAEILTGAGQLEHAAEKLRESRAVWGKLILAQPDRISTWHGSARNAFYLGVIEESLGSLQNANMEYERAWEEFGRLLDIDPEDGDARRDRNSTRARQALIQLRLGNRPQAIELMRESISECEILLKHSPDDANVLSLLSIQLGRLGDLLAANGDFADALESQERAIAVIELLYMQNGDHVQFRRQLLTSRNRIVLTLSSMGKFQAAQDQARQAIANGRSLTEEFPEEFGFRRELAAALIRAAPVEFMAANLMGESREYSSEAQTILSELVEVQPTAPLRRELSIAHAVRAKCLMRYHHHEAALGHLTEALAIAQELCDSDPANLAFAADCASYLLDTAELYKWWKQPELSLDYANQAEQALKAIESTQASERGYLLRRAAILSTRAEALQSLGRRDEAVADAAEAASILRPLLQEDFAEVAVILPLAAALELLGKKQEARELRDRLGSEWLDPLYADGSLLQPD